jgi:hypothetical protein
MDGRCGADVIDTVGGNYQERNDSCARHGRILAAWFCMQSSFLSRNFPLASVFTDLLDAAPEKHSKPWTND